MPKFQYTLTMTDDDVRLLLEGLRALSDKTDSAVKTLQGLLMQNLIHAVPPAGQAPVREAKNDGNMPPSVAPGDGSRGA